MIIKGGIISFLCSVIKPSHILLFPVCLDITIPCLSNIFFMHQLCLNNEAGLTHSAQIWIQMVTTPVVV